MAGSRKNLTFNVLTEGDAAASAAFLRMAASMEALNREMKRVNGSSADVDHSFQQVTRSSDKTHKSMGALLTTAVALGPALVPIGAVAAAAFGGLAVSGGTALLVFKGIQAEMKSGSAVGQVYTADLGKLKTNLQGLEQVAAKNFLGGFHQAVKDLQPLMPVVTRDVGLMSAQMGLIVSHVAPGLLSMFTQLNPLFAQFGSELVKGSQYFQQWASHTGAVTNFVAYAQTQLPSVEATLGSLATTISHVTQGLLPFGSTSLLGLRLLSQAINAIPVGALQTLIPLLAGAALGLKSLSVASAASASLAGLSGKLQATGGFSAGAAGPVGALGKAVGFLGPVGAIAGLALGGLSVIMGRHGQAAVEDQKRVNSLTEALRNNAAESVVLTQLMKSGALPAAQSLGISQDTLLAVVRQQAPAVAYLGKELQGLRGSQADANQAATEALAKFGATSAEYQSAKAYAHNFGHEIDTLSSGLQRAQGDYDKAITTLAEYAQQQGAATLSVQLSTGSYKQAAAALGLTVDAYIAGQLAAAQKTKSDQAQTAAMLAEKDAAGLLKAQFDILNGTTLGVWEANTAFASSLLGLDAQMKINSKDWRNNTEAGNANNRAMQQAIEQAEQHGQAVANAAKSTMSATAATDKGRQTTLADLGAIRKHIAAVGGDTTQIDLLIKSINKTPVAKHTTMNIHKDIATHNLHTLQTDINLIKQGKVPGINANTAAGRQAIRALQYDIDLLKGGKVPVSVSWAGRGGATRATGGLVTGPGGPKDDQVPILASNKEYVVRADAVSKYGVGFFENLNAMKFAGGGPVGSMPYLSQLATSDWANNRRLKELIVPVYAALKAARDAFLNAHMPAAPAAVMGSGNAGIWQRYAASLFPAFGWGQDQLSALISLWNGESGWNPAAYNPNGGATGIPQALPGSKMASEGPDWWWNGATQVRWGEKYIASVYGNPSNAWAQWQARSPHWYKTGAWNIPKDQLAYLHRGEMVVPEPAASQVRSGEGGGTQVVELGPRSLRALAEQLVTMDGEIVARLVTKRQAAVAVRGGRR